MKIAIVGDSPQIPSGFGVQTDLISRGLAKKGHHVYCLNPVPIRQECPENITDVFVDIRDLHSLDVALYRLKCDATIMFSSTFMVSHFGRSRAAQAKGPVFYWFPWEARTLPPGANQILMNTPDNSVVHLSEFAQDLWSSLFKVSSYIPHCVDVDLFKRKDLDVKALRKKWSKRLKYPIYDDTFLIINTDRNIRHKRWDATFSYLKQLVDATDKEVCLIANTKKSEGHFHYNIYGYDLEKASKVYGIEENLVFTDFDWGSKSFSREELVELLSICDLRISTTSGEGFGIPAIECASLEVPQLVNSCPPLNELLPKEFLVAPSFYEWDRDSLWSVPDVPLFVDETLEIIKNGPNKEALADAKRHVAEKFSVDVVVDAWENLICSEGKSAKNHWLSGRWGHTSKTINYMSFRDLTILIKTIKEKAASVLEVGSFTGEFIQFCLDMGIAVRGIESHKEAFDLCSEVTKISCVNSDYLNGLTKVDVYNIVVMTDQVDLLLNTGLNPAEVDSLFSAILKPSVEWLFIRNNPSFYPDGEIKNLDFVDGSLKSCGFTRRQDIETVIKSSNSYKSLTHEIWTRDATIFPKALTTLS